MIVAENTTTKAARCRCRRQSAGGSGKIGVASFPVWLGIAAASEKIEAHQALQCSLLTGGAVYDAFATGGYYAVGLRSLGSWVHAMGRRTMTRIRACLHPSCDPKT